MPKEKKEDKKEEEEKDGQPTNEGLDYEKTENLNPTQANLDIDRVEDGFIILKNGGMRTVLMVSAINFSLKNEEEQNAIIGGYQNFLNSLSFPIQIVSQSRRLDLTNYLQDLEDKMESQSNELLRIQMGDYIGFVRRLIDVANIMEKNFFIVVPFEPIGQKSVNPLDKIRKSLFKSKQKVVIPDYEAAKKELRQRAGLVASGLSSLGIRAIQLNTQELIELLYTSYNPNSAQFQKVATPEEVMSPVIKKGEGEEE